MNQKTLLLTSQELHQLINEDDAYEAMEIVFRAQGEGKTQMPSKVYLNLPVFHGDFRAMPAFIEPLKICGLKWVNSHPDNLIHGQFPAVMAAIFLNDPVTGFPLAMMDGTLITRLRTGAAAALASFFLANPNSKILSLVGCGVQAEAQLKAHIKKFRIDEVRVWGPKIEYALSFKERMNGLGVSINVFDKIRDCIRGSDILCTTTPSRGPLVLNEWVQPGLHINAIGADAKGKQELDPEIIKESRLVVDDLEQSIHGGEINVPFAQGTLHQRDIDAILGEVVCGIKPARRSTQEITVFDSTGLAIQDVALGFFAYQKALKMGVGTYISLI